MLAYGSVLNRWSNSTFRASRCFECQLRRQHLRIPLFIRYADPCGTVVCNGAPHGGDRVLRIEGLTALEHYSPFAGVLSCPQIYWKELG